MQNPETVAKLAEIASLYDEASASSLVRSDLYALAASAGRNADYWQSMLDDRQSLANLSNYVGSHELAVIAAYRAAETKWLKLADRP